MSTAKKPVTPHLTQFVDNLNEVGQLLEIHTKVAGAKPGRKYDVEVLNKSAVVLLVACWEAFVEDLAEAALRALVDNAKGYEVLPDLVLDRVASKNSGRNAWALAGDGWKAAVRDNLKEVLAKTVGALNTPKTQQVDELFSKAIGLPEVSKHWHWNRRTVTEARDRLDALITLRGSIAHRVKHSDSVHKRDVTDAADFIGRLAECTGNAVRQFVHERTGTYPWPHVKYEGRVESAP